MKTAQPTSIPIKYTGSVSLNARTLTGVSQTLAGVDANGTPLQGRPMTMSELMQLLNYLEICVMSDRLYFDGTLPKHELELLAVQINALEKFSNVDIVPIVASDSRQLIGFCQNAAEQASELIREIDPSTLISNTTDRPVKQISGFREAVLRDYPDKNARLEAAQQITFDLLSGRDSFNGGKCVVGLLTAELEQGDLLDIVAQKFRACSDDTEQSYLVGALINRFRINYVNKLSSQDAYEAAYLIDPSIESIQSQQIFLLWKYILKRIERKHMTVAHYEQIQHLFKGRYTTFPLGLAALLNRNSTDPFELLSKTLALKNRMFNEVSSKHTPQMRFIHQFDEKAFGDFQDDVLGDAFEKVLKKRSKWCEFVNNRIPEVIGMAASKALSDLIGDMHFAMDFTAEYSTTVLLRDTLTKGLEMILPNRRYNVFLNNMQKLETFYKETLASHGDVERLLSKQVERIFNRPLVFDDATT